jgi:hypothetical protein
MFDVHVGVGGRLDLVGEQGSARRGSLSARFRDIAPFRAQMPNLSVFTSLMSLKSHFVQSAPF